MRAIRFAGFMLACGTASFTLLQLCPSPIRLVAAVGGLIRDPHTSLAMGAAGAATTLAAVVAWLLLGWLTLAGAAAAAASLPGSSGSGARMVSLVLTPRALRPALGAAVGTAALAGSAGAAVAAPPAAPPCAALDWPVPAPRPTAEAPAARLDRHSAPSATPRLNVPRQPRPGTHAPAAKATAAANEPVVVRPGDSLWSIAADRLGPAAADERIAVEWPRWWAANRELIGADPALINPGQRLTPPAAQPLEDQTP